MLTPLPYPRFSEQEMARRYAAARRLMLEEDLSALLIYGAASAGEVLDKAEFIHRRDLTIYDDLLHGFGSDYLPPVLRTRRTGSAAAAPFTFQENMTVVIQPNVITKDERMGVQVGELVRVTTDGVESLHHYPMHFIRCD